MSEAAVATTETGTNGASLLSGGAKGNGAKAPANGNGEGKNGNGGDGWWQSFGDGLEGDTAKDWQGFASRYSTPQDFAKSHVELRKTAIFVPGNDAKPEAWGALYDRLGRPKDAKEYKFTDSPDLGLDDTDKELRESFRPVAHRVGLTQKQVNELEGWQYQNVKIQRDAYAAKATKTTETNIKTLKAEMGVDFDKNISNYNSALKAYAGTDYKTFHGLQLADGTFLGDHPAFVRMMSKIGAERAEDERFADQFNPSGKQSALTEIAKIENEATGKGLYPTHPQWPNDVLKPLYAKAYGTKPLVMGRTGR